jgi:hypothetical protein
MRAFHVPSTDRLHSSLGTVARVQPRLMNAKLSSGERKTLRAVVVQHTVCPCKYLINFSVRTIERLRRSDHSIVAPVTWGWHEEKASESRQLWMGACLCGSASHACVRSESGTYVACTWRGAAAGAKPCTNSGDAPWEAAARTVRGPVLETGNSQCPMSALSVVRAGWVDPGLLYYLSTCAELSSSTILDGYFCTWLFSWSINFEYFYK